MANNKYNLSDETIDNFPSDWSLGTINRWMKDCYTSITPKGKSKDESIAICKDEADSADEFSYPDKDTEDQEKESALLVEAFRLGFNKEMS
jgi:hypothetical protein